MKKYFTAFLVASAFFLAGVFTLSAYGLNWDTPYRLLRGQAFVPFFSTGQTSYKNEDTRTSPFLIKPGEFLSRINFLSGEGPKPAKLSERPLPRLEYKEYEQGSRTSFYKHSAWDPKYYLSGEEPGHLPLPEEGAAFFNRLFWGELGWFGDIESHQLFFVLISSLGIFIVSIFAFQITHSIGSGQAGSWLAAVVAGLSLGLYPLFFSESHFNLKDPLQASFFAGSVWTFWNWVRSGKLGWFAGFGVFVALALAIKWNIGFLPIIVLPWLFLIRKTEQFNKWFKIKKLLISTFLFLLFTFLFLILIWPTSWQDPIGWLSYLPYFYFDNGIGTDHIQPEGFVIFGFNLFDLASFLTQTPEVVLILGGIGLFWGIRGFKGEKLKVGFLLVLWLCVPLVRTMIPGVRNYSGLRQIMEVLPAMAVLAGLGAEYINQKLKIKYQNYISRNKILLFDLLFCIFIFTLLIIPIIRLHPNENLYFNAFVGGINGASKHNLIDLMVSYGNVYKQAAIWINENASKDSNLTILEGHDYALSPLWLREDISISPNHFSGLDKKGEYIFVLRSHHNQPSFARSYPEIFLNPVHQIKVDGVSFLSIYQNSEKFTKSKFKEESSTSDFKVHTVKYPGGSFIDLDLGQNLLVTRIILENASPICKDMYNFALIDETITFIPEDENKNLQSAGLEDSLYSLQERKRRDDGRVEYNFPAVKARLVRIYPKYQHSCFITGKISSVSYLAD